MQGKTNVKYQLTISALEFYCCAGFDLLDNHNSITIDHKQGPLAPATIDLNEISDLMPVLE